jgi:multisubunit Na+/H+ antiporter MnhE subunit
LGNPGAMLRALLAPRALADLAAAGGLWLLLAGSLHPQELAAALLVGLVVAVVGVLVRSEVDHRPVRLVSHLPTLGRQYLGALRDSWTLTVALLRPRVGRPPTGRVRVVPFTFGEHTGDAVGRRVVATLGTSLQPNTYVLGFDRDRGVVLVHELVPEDGDPVPASLCAGDAPATEGDPPANGDAADDEPAAGDDPAGDDPVADDAPQVSGGPA